MKIMFVGDINLGEYYTTFGSGPGTLAQSEDLFSKVSHIFSQADMIVGNLEASICSAGLNPNEPESAVLRARPETAALLKKHNFKLVQVANNHMVQHGTEAFQECLAILDQQGIKYAGISNAKPVIFTENNLTIGFLAASDVPDNTHKQQNLYQRLDDTFFTIIAESVKTVDHLIVMLHWGLEASTAPLPYQREMAKRLRELGVRIVIGSHPHLFYEIEATPNFVCAYSLGNFVFDLCWEERLLKSGILEVNIENGLMESKVWPIVLVNNGAIPTPTRNPQSINGNVTLYDLGKAMRWQQIKKMYFLLRNFFSGNSKLKWIFLKRKITGKKANIVKAA